MSDRVCVRGCTQKDVHYATCADYGLREAYERALAVGVTNIAYKPNCSGCAPVECRDGSMICDRCFGRLRRFISDAPDLLGRLRSMADPSKAMTIERGSGGGKSVEAPAPVPPDLIDAAEDVMRSLRGWAVSIDRSLLGGGVPAGAGAAFAYEIAHTCAQVILTDLSRIANNRDEVLALSAVVLDVHPVDDDGVRPFWSVVDAIARYRLERPDDSEPWAATEDDEELLAVAVPESGVDSIIFRVEAERVAGSSSTLRRWVKSGDVPFGLMVVAGASVQWFRRADVVATRERMQAKKASTQYRADETPNLENRSQ